MCSPSIGVPELSGFSCDQAPCLDGDGYCTILSGGVLNGDFRHLENGDELYHCNLNPFGGPPTLGKFFKCLEADLIVPIEPLVFTLPCRSIGTSPCAGDCDGDGTTQIQELISGVNAARDGNVAACPAFDRDSDGMISVGELVSGVHAALGPCGL